MTGRIHLHGWGGRVGVVTLSLLMALLAACGNSAPTAAPVGGGTGGQVTPAGTTVQPTPAARVATPAGGAGTRTSVVAPGGPAKQVKLGVVFSLTGDNQVYGNPQRNAVQMAVEEINASGYIPGVQLVPVIEDDAGKKDQGITAFDKLIKTDNVIAIIGPTLSSTAVSTDPDA